MTSFVVNRSRVTVENLHARVRLVKPFSDSSRCTQKCTWITPVKTTTTSPKSFAVVPDSTILCLVWFCLDLFSVRWRYKEKMNVLGKEWCIVDSTLIWYRLIGSERIAMRHWSPAESRVYTKVYERWSIVSHRLHFLAGSVAFFAIVDE